MIGLSKRTYGMISLSLALCFGIILIAMHLLEPELNTRPVSLYSLGAFGFVMRVGFASLGLAFFTLLMGLWSEARKTALSFADLILFFISGLGLVLIGIFNTDAPGTVSATAGGLIHSSAALAWSLACSIGITLFAIAFLQDDSKLEIGRWSRNLGVTILMVWFAGFLGQLTIVSTAQPRIFYSLVVVWILMVANQLRTDGLKVASTITT